MAKSRNRQRSVDALVIHHTVVPEQDWSISRTTKALRNSHLAYDGKAPYHRVIGKSWKYKARPDYTIGYHAGNWDMNTRSIGIALVGDFTQDQPTDYQKKELANAIRDLMKKYNIPRKRVFLHKEIKKTACPGTFITHAFIDIILESTMSCEKYKELDKERVAQIKRLQKESRKLTGMVHGLQGEVKEFEQVTIPSMENRMKLLETEITRKEKLIQKQETEIKKLERHANDASQTVEENLKKRLATRIWNWLFREG